MKALIIGVLAIAWSLGSAFVLSACMFSSRISRYEETRAHAPADAGKEG